MDEASTTGDGGDDRPDSASRPGPAPPGAAGARLRLGRWLLLRARPVALAAVVGTGSGLASAAFLVALDRATEAHRDHPGLVALLPVVGLAVGLAYHQLGGRAGAGTDLVLAEARRPRAGVPWRMAPLVLLGTLATHLAGGSAGREGTAIQVAGSLTDGAARAARLGLADRRVLLVAAVAGGFGSVFGVPLAGAVFALEVVRRHPAGPPRPGRRSLLDAAGPALVASVVGDQVVRALGVSHTPTPALGPVDLGPGLLVEVAGAGVAFGLVAATFVAAVEGVRALAGRLPWAPARPVVGGLAVLALLPLVGTRAYLGLSLPLLTDALAGGAGVAAGAFALKALFTAVTLGSGFRGGEVTPLFVVGATCGATVGDLLGRPVPVMAAVGLVAVFAGATKAPVACTVLGVELFGPAALVLFAVACGAAVWASGDRSVYREEGEEGLRPRRRPRWPGRRTRRGRGPR